jgi:hypothetical protein
MMTDKCFQARTGFFLFVILFLIMLSASQLSAAVYYVATTGNDANSGTETLPWNTIQKAANTMIAGDSVYLRGGTYPERVTPQNSGSGSNYIVYAAYPGETVIIDGSGISLLDDLNGLFEISGKDYIRVSGLRIMNAGPNMDNAGILVSNSSHIIIERNYTYNTVSSGIAVWGSNNITVDENEVELACNDGRQECISVAGTENFEVMNNHVHNSGPGTNGGEGIDIKDGSSNGTVHHNRVHNVNRLGIYVDAWDKHTSHIEVYQNVAYENAADGFVIASEMGGLLENIRVYNNIAYHNRYIGFSISPCCPESATHPMQNIEVINNTFYNNGWETWGGGIAVDNPDIQNVIIRNNIVSRNLYFQIAVAPAVSLQNISIDHNLIDGYRDTEGETYGSDSVTGDPLFVNAGDGDFHLQPGSPAIDTASSLNAPSDDFDGNTRPSGSGYDIGAYEFGAGIPDLPDLTGHWDPISQTCKNSKKGMKCKVKGTVRITNTGTENAPTSVVRYYLSQDAVYDGTDMELKRVSTGTVKTGKTKSKTFSYSFPTGSSASCQYLIAVIDADSGVEEISEANNQIVHYFDNGQCTDMTPPSVILTSPAGNATGVSVNTLITAMFSEPLNASTVDTSTFTVNGVTGTVTYSGTTATFTPSGSLNENTTYTATITTGVRDAVGNAMASDYVWSFTTGSSIEPPPTTLTNLFFLHHSTGDGLITEGNMRGAIASYNTAHGTQFVFWDHGYNGDGLRDPSGNSTGTNYDIPGDNTDPDGLYNLWTSTETEYINARNQILNNHEVIAFKSCFPASDIEDAAELAQYQTWYLGMRDFFDTRPDRLFIVMSTPPLHRRATNAAEASNARAFANWLCSDAYLSGHPNVRCFNLFDNLAQSNDGSATANMLRYEYEGSHSNSDSHPNTLANQTVGPVFAEFLCNAAQGY